MISCQIACKYQMYHREVSQTFPVLCMKSKDMKGLKDRNGFICSGSVSHYTQSSAITEDGGKT